MTRGLFHPQGEKTSLICVLSKNRDFISLCLEQMKGF